MATSRKRSSLRADRRSAHPYICFEDTPLWVTIERALAALEENRDIQLTTAPEYIVGLISKRLAEEALIKPSALKKKAPPNKPMEPTR